MSNNICFLCNITNKTNYYIPFVCKKAECFHMVHKQCYITNMINKMTCTEKIFINKYYKNNNYKNNIIFILLKKKLNIDVIFNIYKYIYDDFSIITIINNNNNKINIINNRINNIKNYSYVNYNYCLYNKYINEIKKLEKEKYKYINKNNKYKQTFDYYLFKDKY